MSSTNFKCIPLLNLLRFQGGELEERVFDAKFQDFMAAAKSDLEKAQTKKAKALIYHATISAQQAFLERKGFESAVMQGLALEVEGRQPWILILCEGKPRSSAWESDAEDQKELHERSSTCRCDFRSIPETLPTPWKHKLLFQNVNRLETVT